VRATAGTVASMAVSTVVPSAGSLSREAILSGQVVVTDQVPVELSAAMTPDSDTMAIGARLVIRNEPFGALALAARRLDEHDRRLFATCLGVADTCHAIVPGAGRHRGSSEGSDRPTR
jgi:hypothetical protein